MRRVMEIATIVWAVACVLYAILAWVGDRPVSHFLFLVVSLWVLVTLLNDLLDRRVR
jgi:hypothetical protein